MTLTDTQYNELITAGGAAVPGVVAIFQENSMETVSAIMKTYLPLLNIMESDLTILGSTGKKAPNAISGDIDIAISAPALLNNNNLSSLDSIYDLIINVTKELNYPYRDMRNLGIISIGFPIVNVNGLQSSMMVQLDFMIVESVDFAAWSYFAPSYLESKLKGLYRNELNHAVAKYTNFSVTKVHDDLKPIEWERMWFDLKNGLHKGKQSLVSPKTGKIIKSPTVISKEHVSDDPDTIVKILYGPEYVSNDILTFEQAFEAILSDTFPHRNYRSEIFEMAAKGIKDKGYPVPEVLENKLK